jgi:hypothetical protein
MIAKKLRGRLSWYPLLIYVYFEDETGLAIGRQAAHQRRGAADCGEYREATRIVGKVLD